MNSTATTVLPGGSLQTTPNKKLKVSDDDSPEETPFTRLSSNPDHPKPEDNDHAVLPPATPRVANPTQQVGSY